MGEKNLAETLKEYYREFKFKHPTPNDFRRVAKRVSQIQLKWYSTDWTQTIKTIDYSIKTVETKKHIRNHPRKGWGNSYAFRYIGKL